VPVVGDPIVDANQRATDELQDFVGVERTSEKVSDSSSRTGRVDVSVEHKNDIRLGDIEVEAEIEDERDLDRLESDILDEVDQMIQRAVDELRRDMRGR